MEWNIGKEVVGWLDDDDKFDISEEAKDPAWHDVLRRLGREGVLAIPNLPPTLRARLEEKPKEK